MPAPATSSRHLYTGHRRGHIQPAPRLRAHRSGPLSRDHPQIPVSMPSLFRFDASAVVHTCSSSHRTPAPLTARRHPQRSPPRLLTDAACGGLESPPPRRPRRTHLHHWHSTDRADDLLHHHHHFPSGHTWVPIIRSWALTRGFALHPGTRNRYEIRYTRTQHRPASRQVNDHGRVFGTHGLLRWRLPANVGGLSQPPSSDRDHRGWASPGPLGTAGAPIRGHLRHLGVIATPVAVAAELAIHRRAMPAQAPRCARDAHACS